MSYNAKIHSQREKIYHALVLTLVILGFMAYVPSLLLSIHEELWWVAALDTFAYLFIVGLYFIRSIPYAVRVYGLLLVVYVLGVALLLLLGAVGAGLIWLFAFPVFASLLKGFRTSVIAIIINAATILILGFLLQQGMLKETKMSTYALESWIIISVNFICLNGLVSIPIAVLIKGLRTSIVEEHESRELVDKRNQELDRINKDLDNFIYMASHDLKSPISNIEGLIGILRKDLKDKKVPDPEIIGLIETSIANFKSTVHALTEVRTFQKNSEDTPELIDIPSMIEQITINLSGLIRASRPILKTELSIEKINFSRKNLYSIFYNLINNAIKYCDPEKPACEILIRTEMSEDYFVFTVKDNGLGMNPDYNEKIFRIFKRMHMHVEGKGVGLYIIRKIVENNDGKIEVKSELGKGSEFKIFLRVKE